MDIGVNMIIHPCCWTAPLAGADSFVHMGRQFQRHALDWQARDIILCLGVSALTIISICLMSRYMRHREGGGYYSPSALFLELCRAHRLNWSARRLLWQLARRRQLSNPAQLFVEPQHFEPDPLSRYSQDRVNQL